MKLYCIIHGTRYEIVDGATFSEEYNETLDSGSIMLDQEPKIENLEPFDDVYIYDDETDGQNFYKHMLVDYFQEELNNVRFEHYKYKINLFSETKRLEKVILPNISITQPVDKKIRRSVWEYLNVYLDLYSPQIKIVNDGTSWKYDKKYSFSDFHNLPAEFEECEYLESNGTQYIDTGFVPNVNTNLKIQYQTTQLSQITDAALMGYRQTSTEGGAFIVWARNSDYANQELVAININEHNDPYYLEENPCPHQWQKHTILLQNGVVIFDGISKNAERLVNQANVSLVLFGLKQGPSTIDNRKFYGKIYSCQIFNGDALVRHFVPALRKSDNVVGLYDTVEQHFYTNDGTGTFLYKKKNKPKHFEFNSVYDKFSDVDAPEMTLTNPTLRDVISQLMLTKDCIPVVHDDVIDFIDVSLRHDEFLQNNQYVNYIHSGMNSEDFSTEARREYSGALSQENTCKMVEYLGFRDSNTSLLTRTDLVLETRYPIYKINKIYMCYYKKATVWDGNNVKYVRFMCKQDITPLVVQNVVRQALSLDPVKFRKLTNLIDNDLGKLTKVTEKDLAKFKICTVGYNIGSNQITGWGETYSFFIDAAYWFKATNTVLENIINFMDAKHPFGYKMAGVAVNQSQELYQNLKLKSVGTAGLDSIDTGNVYHDDDTISNNSVKQKAVFFEVDYNAMFGGAIVHSKDYKDKDDLQTVDNCSSSLTVLEADGLFEKEKMNRLGNRQYNIQARYEGANAYAIMNGPTCNHILGSVLNYSEQDDDVVIYHKEYQIYENVILANFAGTFDYVLKNYFTSVYAKLRTYNLASYGESVKRAENYKEYVILSDEYATYETGTLLDNYLDKYISCFKETVYDKTTYDNIVNSKINFGYIQSKFTGEDIDGSRAFCDVNTFCSGYSMCVNLKMYDNVSQGIYIEDAQVVETYLNDNDEERKVIGSSQEWAIAVNNIEDPFQEKMSFGFGHLYQDGEIIPSGKNAFVPEYAFDLSSTNTAYSDKVGQIYTEQLLILPLFNMKDDNDDYYNHDYMQNSVGYSVNIGGQNGLTIYKDNKEDLDFTFQFETITNSKDVFISSYFVKLNEMCGLYEKWSTTNDLARYYGRESADELDFDIEYTYAGTASNSHYTHVTVTLWLTIPKNKFLEDFSPYVVNQDKAVNTSFALPTSQEWPAGLSSGAAVYKQKWIYSLSINSNNSLTIVFQEQIRTQQAQNQNYPLPLDPWYCVRKWITQASTITTTEIISTPYQQDDNKWFFKVTIADYDIINNIDNYPRFPIYINGIPYYVVYGGKPGISGFAYYENLNHTGQLTAAPTETVLDYNGDFEVNKKQIKNMFAIVSTKPIKKEIIYDSYLSLFKSYLSKITIGTQYTMVRMLYGSEYEDMTFNVVFTDGHGNQYVGIAIDLTTVYFIVDWGDGPLSWTSERAYDDLGFVHEWLSHITFISGQALTQKDFLRYFYKCCAAEIDIPSFSGVKIIGLPNYMQIVNTDDQENEIELNYYIPFHELFYFDKTGIPKIHVGSNQLMQYDGDTEETRIKSIQYWYLDNNSEGSGRLHFVFGVNVEPGQYEKEVFVSVATRRSLDVYSEDHKTVVGHVKQMTAEDYAEQNTMVPVETEDD